jgi:hypothetical protein
MDSGDVIPCLNEDWTFAGCKLMEWMAGLTMALMVGASLHKPANAMPFLVLIMIGTTLVIAMMRKRFPDEERGVRNLCMVNLGFEPIGIPAPSKLQPVWSGAPVRELSGKSLFRQLELEKVINKGFGDPANR